MVTLISEFDYHLPESLIAQEFSPARDESRLLVINRDPERIIHGRLFRDLPEFLDENDILVLNDTSVIPARLSGTKSGTGAEIEMLLLRESGGGEWEALLRPSRRIRRGAVIVFSDVFKARANRDLGEGRWLVELDAGKNLMDILSRIGSPPVPPYIKSPQDRKILFERYQTVYAKKPGAAAAPTAGLHFTPELLQKLKRRGVLVKTVTVHTGLDTFRPVKAESAEEHRIGSEYFEIPEDTARALNERPSGSRVIAVGTTTTRALETACETDGRLSPAGGWTGIFIYPGHRFRAIDALITNFHPPRSTTLLLASAFCGKELLRKAYLEAVRRKYRFLSFGDATFIT